MSMKNSNDTIGTRSSDLPVCSAVPQPLGHCVPLNMTVYTRKYNAIIFTPFTNVSCNALMFSLKLCLCTAHRCYSKVRFTFKTSYSFDLLSAATTLNVKKSLRSVLYFLLLLHTSIMKMQTQECKVERSGGN
jgi:hypothetical protein